MPDNPNIPDNPGKPPINPPGLSEEKIAEINAKILESANSQAVANGNWPGIREVAIDEEIPGKPGERRPKKIHVLVPGLEGYRIVYEYEWGQSEEDAGRIINSTERYEEIPPGE